MVCSGHRKGYEKQTIIFLRVHNDCRHFFFYNGMKLDHFSCVVGGGGEGEVMAFLTCPSNFELFRMTYRWPLPNFQG